jgi:hypothetical protein
MSENTLTGCWEIYLVKPKAGILHKNKPIYTSDKSIFNRHIKPILGNRNPQTITKDDAETLVVAAKDKGMSPQTQKHIIGLLKRILKSV